MLLEELPTPGRSRCAAPSAGGASPALQELEGVEGDSAGPRSRSSWTRSLRMNATFPRPGKFPNTSNISVRGTTVGAVNSGKFRFPVELPESTTMPPIDVRGLR